MLGLGITSNLFLSRMSRLIIIALAAALLSSCTTAPLKPLPDQQAKALLGPNAKKMRWDAHVQAESGFGIYRGWAQPPLSGEIVFVAGTEPPSGVLNIPRRSRTGAFHAVFFQTIERDGSHAQVSIARNREVIFHIFISAKSQADVDALDRYVYTLRPFTK